MSIMNPNKLILDLRSVLASVTLEEMSILTKLQEIIDERTKELKEEYDWENNKNGEDTDKTKDTGEDTRNYGK